MTQTSDHFLAGELLQVIAWLTETNAAKSDITDQEFSSYQMIEGHATSHNISPSLTGSQFNLVVAAKGVDCFSFYQRELEGRFGLIERSSTEGVTVAFKADARNCSRARDGAGWGFRTVGDIDRLYGSGPHL